MGSPAAGPPSPQPAAPIRTPTPGPPATKPAPEEFYDWTGREEETTKSDRSQHPQALRLPCPESLCWRCGVPGHTRGACQAPAVLFCSRCGTLGLMSRDCPCPRTSAAPLPRAAGPPSRNDAQAPEATPCPLCGLHRRRRRNHRNRH
jgi:hypothetical protein